MKRFDDVSPCTVNLIHVCHNSLMACFVQQEAKLVVEWNDSVSPLLKVCALHYSLDSNLTFFVCGTCI